MYNIFYVYFLDSLHLYSILSPVKNAEKLYIATVRSAMYLLHRFSSLSFGLQITLQCINTVFQSCIIYTIHDHLCVSYGSRKTQQFLNYSLTFNLLVCGYVSPYLFLFYVLILSLSCSVNSFTKLNARCCNFSNAHTKGRHF